MSMRRDDVASMLVRRHFNTMCPLGLFRDAFQVSYKYTWTINFIEHTIKAIAQVLTSNGLSLWRRKTILSVVSPL